MNSAGTIDSCFQLNVLFNQIVCWFAKCMCAFILLKKTLHTSVTKPSIVSLPLMHDFMRICYFTVKMMWKNFQHKSSIRWEYRNVKFDTWYHNISTLVKKDINHLETIDVLFYVNVLRKFFTRLCRSAILEVL